MVEESLTLIEVQLVIHYSSYAVAGHTLEGKIDETTGLSMKDSRRV